MAKLLADRDIRKLLGTVILDADEARLNPNGIEMRLGRHVCFQSTGEERELDPGSFLKVRPGESVLISSYEDFRFTRQAIHQVFPDRDLMALITPTTTMMREGIMQAATKVDSGWNGHLNWGLRNSSTKDFLLGFAEPIFKLTIFLLEGEEVPDIPYGQRSGDLYQGTQGIARSVRRIPVQIPKSKLIESSIERIDPTRQLQEAGYPFNYIGTELTNLHGKFEVVSKDVLLLKEGFEEQTKEIRDKIEKESGRLSTKVDESQKTSLREVENLFDRKFLTIAGTIAGLIALMFGAVTFLQSHGVAGTALGWVAVIGGFGILLVVYLIARRKDPK
jgi:deoxycytidine triphosphate deaminase